MKAVALSMLVVLVLVALGWLVAGNELAMMKVFAPATERVRRETFENSKAYRDGMVQELRMMQFEYLKADDAHKAGLANVIRHKVAGVPEDAIPNDLQDFVRELP